MQDPQPISHPLRDEMNQRLQAHVATGGSMGLLISFSGDWNASVADALLVLGEQSVSSFDTPKKKVRRIIHVLIESLQNVARHGWVDSNGKTPFFITLEHTPLGFQIQTGNVVDFDMAAELRERLALVNGMTHEELRKVYVETLCEGELSERGGAGLGLLSMAKRSEGPLNYQFSEYGPDSFLFTLAILVKN